MPGTVTGPGLPMAPTLFGNFIQVKGQPTTYTISGVTKDSTGAILGSCTVRIFETGTDIEWSVVTSDPVGAYTAVVPGKAGMTFYAVAYKAGSPDVSGTTVNTLVGVAS